MNLLFLAEGALDDPSASGSGIPASIAAHLRATGLVVSGADVDLHGWTKAAAAMATFSPRRRRWAVRYHLGAMPFALRSRNASRRVRAATGTDAVIQYGATFHPRTGKRPLFLYCDSNVPMSLGDPFAWAASLRREELAAAIDRERRVCEAAAAIFTASELARRAFIEHFRLPPDKVVTVGAGPNFDVAQIHPRREVRAGGSAPTVLFVGREFARKGGDVLLRAFRAVRAQLPQARLVVAGPEKLRSDEPGVVLLGHLRKRDPESRRRLQQAYEEADVFCLPTRYEPFGIVFVEAMYHGLPVVATRVWAVPEIVDDGTTGFTVPRDDENALAERLLVLLRDPSLARRMGEAGRVRAQSRFTWAGAAQAMARVITPTLEARA
ncbi:MAG: glycosyl transferase family 1 [Acidobacteria bacterium]|nr:MAG: glycosyl transferase family 1 [Acidobacteriota bacterium]